MTEINKIIDKGNLEDYDICKQILIRSLEL